MPRYNRRATRTTNLLERFAGLRELRSWSCSLIEERRRLKIIPDAFGEKAVLKLMFGAILRAAERWRSILITEFEHRQIAALRPELDQEYETVISLDPKPSTDHPNLFSQIG